MSARLLTALSVLALAPVGSTALAPVAGSAGLPALSAGLDRAFSADAAFIRRAKMKVQTSANGSTAYRVIVIVEEDTTNEVFDHVQVTVDGGDGAGSPVRLRPGKVKANGNKRYVSSELWLEGVDVGEVVTVRATLRDAAGGVVGDPKTMRVTVEADGPPEVRSVTITQLDAYEFELRALVAQDLEQEVGAVEVLFQSSDGPAAIPNDVLLTESGRSGGRAVFLNQHLTFEDPAEAAGEPYAAIVVLRGVDGAELSSFETDIVVEGDTLGGPHGYCWDGVQNGSEIGVDCGGACSPCPTVDVGIDLLATLAEEITADAAARLGLVVEAGTVGYELSAGGGIAWTAGTEDGGALVVPDGFASLNVNGGDFVLQDNATFLMHSTSIGVGMSQQKITAYGADGRPLNVWSFDVATPALGDREPRNGGVVGGPAPGGVVVYDTARYGDIIIGGMKLDDSYD